MSFLLSAMVVISSITNINAAIFTTASRRACGGFGCEVLSSGATRVYNCANGGTIIAIPSDISSGPMASVNEATFCSNGVGRIAVPSAMGGVG